VCHLVIARIAPEARVIDLAHGIGGLRAGSVILQQTVTEAPEGSVHLAVVDPGVGTERRALAVITGRGDLLVGPDNGLLMPAADALGGAVGAFELTDPRYRRDPVSATFHGRDVFAPAAAYLALGVRAEEFGPEVDTASLVRLAVAVADVSDGRLDAEVVRVDWYGNLQLGATEADLAAAGLGPRLVVSCDAGDFAAALGRTFADAPAGELVVYVDSGGHVAVACDGSSAQKHLHDPERVTLKLKV
jgi:hypothetical protein